MICPGCNQQMQKVGAVTATEDSEGGAIVFRLCGLCATFLETMRPSLAGSRLEAIKRRIAANPRRYQARRFPEAIQARIALGLVTDKETAAETIAALFDTPLGES